MISRLSFGQLSSRTPVLCKHSFYRLGCVKDRIVDDRKLARIELIRTNLRSLRSSILQSFHISQNGKNFVYRVLAKVFAISPQKSVIKFIEIDSMTYWAWISFVKFKIIRLSHAQH